jgi:outer membrane lipoprotein-sorting protein
MFRKTLVLITVFTVSTFLANASDISQPQAKLSATEIADRNIAARGGQQNWRAVETLVMSGKMEAGGNNRPTIATPARRNSHLTLPPRPEEQVKLPFVMQLKRPRKERIELTFKGQTAVQIFDGTNGWKYRPFLNRKDAEPYTPEEMKAAAMQSDLDGPLVDYAAKGTRIELAGIEKVEDRDAYKLKLTLKGGEVTHVWIDVQTFLEVKVQGTPKRLDGRYRPVEVYYRDFRSVGALKIPYLLETRVLDAVPVPGSKSAGAVTEKILLEKVEVNPKLNDSLFTKAQLEAAPGTSKPEVQAGYSHP